MEKFTTVTDTRFQQYIRNTIVVFASKEMAFVYCLLGTVAQIWHTNFLTNTISAMHGGSGISQAFILSAFISSTLLFFVAVSEEGNRRDKLTVNLLATAEITINLYYYTRNLIIAPEEMRIFDFLFAAFFGTLIPLFIKMYANKIEARKMIHNALNPAQKTDTIDSTKLADIEAIEEKLDRIENDNKNAILSMSEIMGEMREDIDETKKIAADTSAAETLAMAKATEAAEKAVAAAENTIQERINKTSDMALRQFENKIKAAVSKTV